MENEIIPNIGNYKNLLTYQKAVIIYDITYYFCKTYLEKRDRTVDQMVQAARSGKQNIVEGLADGVTSTELQLKLLNVARASLKELRADYEDYLRTRHLPIWNRSHPRYYSMLNFCSERNQISDYEPFFTRWNDEEQCNIALTLLHMTDKMMKTYMTGLEQQFVTQGGIKERMHAARTGYRKGIDEELQRLRIENQDLQRLREENKRLRQQVPILEQRIESMECEKRHLQVLLTQERDKVR